MIVWGGSLVFCESWQNLLFTVKKWHFAKFRVWLWSCRTTRENLTVKWEQKVLKYYKSEVQLSQKVPLVCSIILICIFDNNRILWYCAIPGTRLSYTIICWQSYCWACKRCWFQFLILGGYFASGFIIIIIANKCWNQKFDRLWVEYPQHIQIWC